MRTKKSDLPHHKEGGASSLGCWVSGEAASGGRLGYVNVQRATLAAQQSPSSVDIEEDLSEPCSQYPLVDIEQ